MRGAVTTRLEASTSCVSGRARFLPLVSRSARVIVRAHVRVTFLDARTGEVVDGTASAGDNLLAVAASCGVLNLDDDDYCLEGRCGTCVMEVLGNEGASDRVHACRTSLDADKTCVVGCAVNTRLGDDTVWTT